MNAFDQAAADLEAAKIAEARATQQRVDAEVAMLALMPSKDEGSVTERGLRYKVTASYGFNRTVDAAVVDALMKDDKTRWAAERLFPMKPSLSTSELRFFTNNEPALYALLSAAITSKPAKTSVKVEALEQMREAA